LLIAGGGPEHDDLSRLASRVAPGRVQLLGQVDDPTPVYAAANALVVSSRTEGLPGVLMEAGLSGLPAVTTDVGYVRAIVRDGETGAVVPAGDDAALREAIRAVLEQPGLGTAARAHCLTHFDVREIAKKWDELLAGLEATG
jgi:glycosyltransferase involved in cell wall biosynthesis